MAGRWMAVLATSAFLAVGCGGGGSNGATSGGSTTGGGSTGGGSGGNTTISIASLTFSPQNVTVASPSTITVVNNDSMSHTATSEAAAGAYVVGKAAGGFQFDTGNISASVGRSIVTCCWPTWKT